VDSDPELEALRARLRQEIAERAAGPDPVTAAAPPPEVVHATDATLPKLVRENRIVLIDCWAVWCGPCQAMEPVIQALAEELDGVAVVAKLDTDANPAATRALGVQSIPTLFLFKDGRPVDRIVGVAPKSRLIGWVRQHAGVRGPARGGPGPRR